VLRGALFEPLSWSRALYIPPFRGRRLVKTGESWDRVMRRIAPALFGVHVVEAGKSLYGALPIKPGKAVPHWASPVPDGVRRDMA
jgi:hypothetical protein